MIAYSKLIHAVVLLIKIRRTVPSDLYESARDALFEAFDALAENPIGGLDMSVTICERDNNGDKAKLVVLFGMDSGGVLCHLASKDKSIMIKNERETAGDRGSIVVDGHLWSWSEMVDGVIAAFGLVTASMYDASDRNIAEARREFDERKKVAATAAAVSKLKRRFVEAVFLQATVAFAVTDAAEVDGLIPSVQQLLGAEKAFFSAVDAGAAYVKEAKIDPIVVGSKGNNNLVIDENGLTVIFPDGSAHITIDDIDSTAFATFYAEDRGMRQTWFLRDALDGMKTFLGRKDAADTAEAASTEVAS